MAIRYPMKSTGFSDAAGAARGGGGRGEGGGRSPGPATQKM